MNLNLRNTKCDSIKKGRNKHENAKLFADTTTDLLLRKMLYPDVIEIRKGYFPETTQGINCSFVFVNLDMDLYLPMLAGLKFFWDRLVMDAALLYSSSSWETK